MDSQDLQNNDASPKENKLSVSSLKNNYDIGKFISRDEGSLLTKFLSFSGRLDRLPYLLRLTALWIITFVLVIVIAMITMGNAISTLIMGGMPRGGDGMAIGGLLILIIVIIAIISYMSLAWRRLHDMDKTGLIALVFPALIILSGLLARVPLLAFIAYLAAVVFSIWLMITRGSYGENKYGKDILLERSQKYVGKSETSVFS